jgi:hypothetical protein
LRALGEKVEGKCWWSCWREKQSTWKVKCSMKCSLLKAFCIHKSERSRTCSFTRKSCLTFRQSKLISIVPNYEKSAFSASNELSSFHQLFEKTFEKNVWHAQNIRFIVRHLKQCFSTYSSWLDENAT